MSSRPTSAYAPTTDATDPSPARLAADLARAQYERDAAHAARAAAEAARNEAEAARDAAELAGEAARTHVAALEEELTFVRDLLRGERAHAAHLAAGEVAELRAERASLFHETELLQAELAERAAETARATARR